MEQIGNILCVQGRVPGDMHASACPRRAPAAPRTPAAEPAGPGRSLKDDAQGVAAARPALQAGP